MMAIPYYQRPESHEGTILAIVMTPGSGIAHVRFDDGVEVPISSGHGLRQMADAFGSLSKARGATIEYSIEDGLMAAFSILERAAEPVVAPPRIRAPRAGRAFP